jgi:hypothetical protein
VVFWAGNWFLEYFERNGPCLSEQAERAPPVVHAAHFRSPTRRA